jgi:hypothetical protein
MTKFERNIASSEPCNNNEVPHDHQALEGKFGEAVVRQVLHELDNREVRFHSLTATSR